MPDISAGWLALAGALLGGSGLKVIEFWLNKPKVQADTATEFRNELREEVKTLREELHRAEEEIDKWRDQYYTVMDEFLKFKSAAIAVQNLGKLVDNDEPVD